MSGTNQRIDARMPAWLTRHTDFNCGLAIQRGGRTVAALSKRAQRRVATIRNDRETIWNGCLMISQRGTTTLMASMPHAVANGHDTVGHDLRCAGEAGGSRDPDAQLPAVHARAIADSLTCGRLLAWDSVLSGEYLHSSVLVVTGSQTYVLHDVITNVSHNHDELLNEMTLISPTCAQSVYNGLQIKVAAWRDQSASQQMSRPRQLHTK